MEKTGQNIIPTKIEVNTVYPSYSKFREMAAKAGMGSKATKSKIDQNLETGFVFNWVGITYRLVEHFPSVLNRFHSMLAG